MLFILLTDKNYECNNGPKVGLQFREIDKEGGKKKGGGAFLTKMG